MVHPQQMQDRRVQIVDVDAAFNRFVANRIGGSVSHAAFDTTAGQPCGEAAIVVSPTVVVVLLLRRATEFARPDQQRVLQQAALLEVCQ